jgi:hypothetical protein
VDQILYLARSQQLAAEAAVLVLLSKLAQMAVLGVVLGISTQALGALELPVKVTMAALEVLERTKPEAEEGALALLV